MGQTMTYVLKVGCDTSLAVVTLGILLLWKELFDFLCFVDRASWYDPCK